MRRLRKDDNRFWAATEIVIETLDLTKWRIKYVDANRKNGKTLASCHCDYDRRKARIQFFDRFYNETWEEQMITIIHEHLHVAMAGVTLWCEKVSKESVGGSWIRATLDSEEDLLERLDRELFGILKGRLWRACVGARIKGLLG